MQELTKEIRISSKLKHDYIKWDKAVMFFVCVGFIIAVTIDNAFMGEASCMMDIHKVCRSLNFNTVLESALYMGLVTGVSMIGMVGFLMLIQYLILEIKCRVEKIQECLLSITNKEESRDEIKALPTNQNEVALGNVSKVY